MQTLLEWQNICDKFARDGDFRAMRAAASETENLAESGAQAAALAMRADAALLADEREEAEQFTAAALQKEAGEPRARLVEISLLAGDFALQKELPALRDFIAGLEETLAAIETAQRKRRAHQLAESKRDNDDAQHLEHLLFRALGLLADGAYLAAEPEEAARALRRAAALAKEPWLAANLYSKFLFMRNYRRPGAGARDEAELFNAFFYNITPYQHENVLRSPEKRLRIGYIGRDFRLHAMAYFLTPFFRDYDPQNFQVFVYSFGPSDSVTARFQHYAVTWRDLRGRSARFAARRIAEDGIDILFDLSGHTQDNVLPVMAYHAAPIQLSGLGYVATTGLSAIDDFLVDQVTQPYGTDAGAFVETPVRLARSQFCYAPQTIREAPPVAPETAYARNGYVTFGCFNNLAKLSDEMLLCWRAILDSVKESHLILKGKTLSVPDGRALFRARLQKLGLPVGRIEFRPFSERYLEEYGDVDLALDPFPYNGGLTTCEALYMGVPVITLRGRTHGSRFGASLLTAAGLPELVAEDEMTYAHKASALARHPELLERNHRELRAHLESSALMDAKGYMRAMEKLYRDLWRNYVAQNS